jgi:hypothetical protein
MKEDEIRMVLIRFVGRKVLPSLFSEIRDALIAAKLADSVTGAGDGETFSLFINDGPESRTFTVKSTFHD